MPSHPALRAEVALEDGGFLLADAQQRGHDLFRDVVGQVAHVDGRPERAQGQVLAGPVAHAVDVDLPEHGRLGAVRPVLLAVRGLPDLRRRVAHVGGQRIAGQCLCFAVHLEREGELVGDQVVDLDQRVHAIDVLEVDHLLLRLAERVPAHQALLGQVVAQVAGVPHQPRGVVVVERPPPQAEEQHAVAEVRRRLLDAPEKSLRLLAEHVAGKPEFAVPLQLAGGVRELLQGGEQPRKILRRDAGRQKRPHLLDARDDPLEPGDPAIESRGPPGQQFVYGPAVLRVLRHRQQPSRACARTFYSRAARMESAAGAGLVV